MIEKTETGALIKALIAAQKEFKPLQKDAENPYFSSKYATLDAVINATTAALQDHGLAIVQTFAPGPALVTTLYHVSGESITGVQPLEIEKQTPQALASASTYARRYGWQAILGITAEEDDDGNQAEAARPQAHKPAPVPDERESTKERIAKILEASEKDKDIHLWLGEYLTEARKTIDELDKVDRLGLINFINKKKAEKKGVA